MKQFWQDSLSVIKLRISVMQIITVLWGYWLAHPNPSLNITVFFLAIGTFLVSSGAGMLNHYLERQTDTLMIRTQSRPLVTGRFNPGSVFIIGLLVSGVGLGLLFRYVTPSTGMIAGLTLLLYLLVYTPLKRFTWLNTAFGTIPGALPPFGGWVAGAVQAGLPPVGPGAWVLLVTLIAWQHPHFYAIGCLYKDDYKRAGLPILPNYDPEGARMRRHIIISCLILMLAGYQLYALTIMGFFGFIITLALTLYYFILGLKMIQNINPKTAKALVRGSIIYLVGLIIITAV